MSKFSKGPGYWRSIPEDKLQAMLSFQNEYEYSEKESYFKTWSEMFKQMFSK